MMGSQRLASMNDWPKGSIPIGGRTAMGRCKSLLSFEICYPSTFQGLGIMQWVWEPLNSVCGETEVCFGGGGHVLGCWAFLGPTLFQTVMTLRSTIWTSICTIMYLYYVVTIVELFCFQVVLSELHVYFKRPSFTTNLHLTQYFM